MKMLNIPLADLREKSEADRLREIPGKIYRTWKTHDYLYIAYQPDEKPDLDAINNNARTGEEKFKNPEDNTYRVILSGDFKHDCPHCGKNININGEYVIKYTFTKGQKYAN